MELAGRVALVTGAGSGIGKATAFRLAREGARIGALSDTKEEVDQTAREIAASGGEAISLFADVGDEAAMQRATDDLLQQYGRLDIVIANAGINGTQAPIDELKPGEWDETIRTNYYTVPHLKKSGAGAIVLVSSINGSRTFSNAGSTAYSCTKAAQIATAKQQALELAKHGIRVNVICPGSIATEIGENEASRHTDRAEEPVEYPQGQIPLTRGRSGTAAQCAELILFLVSDRSSHITGTPVFIDGAQSLIA